MNRLVAYVEQHRAHYIIAVVLLSVITYRQYLTFTFWKDDWQLLWSAIYNIGVMHQYWVHPATVVEFMWFTKLFGLHQLWWQLFGLGLHIGVALVVSRFAVAVTESSIVGFLSGLLYAVCVIGMDAVGWPSAHVVLMSAIFLLIGATYAIEYLRRRKSSSFILAALYIGIGFVCDPFRNFPIFFLLPLTLLIVKLSREMKRTFIRGVGLGALGFLTVKIFVFGIFAKEILGSEFFKHLLAVKNPADILAKIYVVGNYFSSMANLMIGWAFKFPEDASTGRYNWWVARIGFVIFCAIVGAAHQYLKLRSRKIGIILFLFSWMAIFYIPNWLFEPRLTMGVTHRYMAISGLGFVVLVAYLMSLVKNKTWKIFLAAMFIVLNIRTVNYYLTVASQYRSASVVRFLWATIDHDVQQNNNLIFVLEGEEPLKTYALGWSGPAPFGLRRRLVDVYNLPILTGDTILIQELLCHTNVPRVQPGSWTVQRDVVPLNHVFAWRVNGSGLLENTTSDTRRSLLISALDADCVPTIDQEVLPENIQ